MNRFLLIVTALLTATGVWAQNTPGGPKGPANGPGMGMAPPSLTDQGFSEAEAKVIEADQKAWEQSNREWEADLQVIEAQRTRLMVKETLDKAALEAAVRSQYEILIARDLARINLLIKWRTAYGLEKSRVLEGRLRGPQGGNQPGGQMGQPGQMGQMGQPNQPGEPGQKKP